MRPSLQAVLPFGMVLVLGNSAGVYGLLRCRKHKSLSQVKSKKKKSHRDQNQSKHKHIQEDLCPLRNAGRQAEAGQNSVPRSHWLTCHMRHERDINCHRVQVHLKEEAYLQH